MSEYLYTHDALTVPRGDDAGQLLAPRTQCDADSQLDVAAFRDRGFLILKDAAASDAIARAAAYVATHEACWSAPSGTRPDDWRMHRDQRLDAPVADGHLPILDLLREPRLAAAIRCLAGAEAHAVSYTQVARRTPAPRKARRKNLPDTSYHIDGEANASGARFPDVFSLLVAVALTPHERPGMGNLTVFPQGHLRDWRQYPDWKRDKALPDIGRPYEVPLAVGDAVLCHPLLPHRGGRNDSDASRDLVFFRVQLAGIDYATPERAAALLADPWAELRVPSSA